MELPSEAWIIVYAWNEPSDWIGSFPSNLYQQILTDDWGKLPRHFDSFDEAAVYAENECLINPLIIPIAGAKAIQWHDKQTPLRLSAKERWEKEKKKI